MLGVFPDRASLGDDIDLNRLEQTLPRWHCYGESSHEALLARVREATVIVTNKVMIDEAVMQAAAQLKLICISATGTNNVDLVAAKRRNIAVCNVPLYSTAAVAQHVFTLMLALSTRLLDYHQAVAQGHWQRSRHFCLLDFPIRELAGKTLGIVGYGAIGQAVAGIAAAFGMRTMIAARSGAALGPERVALHDLLPQVDVLSIHCPLTPETRGLIGEAELKRLPTHALLINTARGGIVDEAALAQALINGELGGAGIDVLTDEPPVHGNPLLAKGIPNLIVTPHIAWASREARQRLIDEVTLNIEAFLQGRIRHRVA